MIENENPFQQTKNVSHDGFVFTRKKLNIDNTLYWCKYSRSEKCPVKISVHTNGEVLLRGGEHSDGCKFRNGRGANVNATTNFTHEMKEIVEVLALGNLA